MLIKVWKHTLHATYILTLGQNIVQGVLVNGSVGRITDFLTCYDAKTFRGIEIALSPRDREENPKTGEVRVADHLWENQTKWPVVEFPNGRTRLLPRHEFTVENVNGGTYALRLQVPLILAWAISIHKSQGQTLQRVRVNLGKIFEKGQGQRFCMFGGGFALIRGPAAYVALSRATSLQSLQVLNFSPARYARSNTRFRSLAHVVSRVMVHETVLNWHEQNVERDRKARSFAEEVDGEQAVAGYVDVDSDRE